MRTKLFLVIPAMLLLLMMLAVACGDDDGDDDGASAGQSGDRLQVVKDRGKLICASRNDVPGYGSLDASRNNVGFDIDLCLPRGCLRGLGRS